MSDLPPIETPPRRFLTKLRLFQAVLSRVLGFGVGIWANFLAIGDFIWKRPKLAGVLSGGLVIAVGWWATQNALDGPVNPQKQPAAVHPLAMTSADPLQQPITNSDVVHAEPSELSPHAPAMLTATPVNHAEMLPASRPVNSAAETADRARKNTGGPSIQSNTHATAMQQPNEHADNSHAPPLPIIVPSVKSSPPVTAHQPHDPFGQHTTRTAATTDWPYAPAQNRGPGTQSIQRVGFDESATNWPADSTGVTTAASGGSRPTQSTRPSSAGEETRSAGVWLLGTIETEP